VTARFLHDTDDDVQSVLDNGNFVRPDKISSDTPMQTPAPRQWVALGTGAISVVLVLATPGLLRAPMGGHESVTIGSLRAIHSAQATFAATCGEGWFASSLESLATAPDRGVPFVNRELTADPTIRSGYSIAVVGAASEADAPVACNGTRAVSAYFVSATPLEARSSRERFFATNQTGTIFQSESPIAVTYATDAGDATPLR
jgi:hypothetical protein